MRLGFDATAVQRGTQVMLDQQKRASMEYVGFWESAMAKRDAAEAKLNDASLARARANLAARAKMNEEFFASQAAQYEIAAGSVPANMIRGGERSAERGAVEGVEAGAAGGTGAVVGMRGIRALMTGTRGVLIGSWNLVIRAMASGLASLGVTLTTLLTGLPIIGAGVAAIVGNFKMRGGLAEMQGAYGTDKTLEETTRKIAGRLAREIARLRASGQLAGPQLDDALTLMDKGGLDNLRRVQRIIAQALPGGFGTEGKTLKEQREEADRLAAEEQKQIDGILKKKRDEFTLEQDIAAKTEDIRELKLQMAGYDGDSLEHHKLTAELLGKELELLKDQTQQQAEQERLAREAKEWHEWSQRAARDWMTQRINAAQVEAEYPTMADLAGRRWTGRLNKQYGAGGRFDVGRGDGPFSGIARDYLLAQKQQIWDRTYGNMGAAESDRQRMMKDVTELSKAGVASPTQLLGRIGDHAERLRQLFDALTASGAISTSVTVDDK